MIKFTNNNKISHTPKMSTLLLSNAHQFGKTQPTNTPIIQPSNTAIIQYNNTAIFQPTNTAIIKATKTAKMKDMPIISCD